MTRRRSTATKTAEPAGPLFGDAPLAEAASKGAVAVAQPQAQRMPAPREQPSIMHVIASAASNSRVQPDKMRLLLDMQKEVMAEEARMAFTAAKIAMRRVTPQINKDGKIIIEDKPGRPARANNKPQLFASFENIMTIMQPVLLDHGFDLWFAPDVGESNRLILRGHLDHIKGHSKTCAIPMPLENSGSKNDAQGMGSSITYGKRYATIALLNIISHAKQDRDIDGNIAREVSVLDAKADVITAAQAKQLDEAITDCGVGTDTFCNKYGIENVADLPAKQLQEALNACANFKANNPKKAKTQ